MSVDLHIDRVGPIHILALLPKIRSALAELLAVQTVPELSLERLHQGRNLPIVTDRIGVDGSPMLLLSVVGEQEKILLSSISNGLTVTIYGPRSTLQYVLGAAAAMVLAHEFATGIWDDQKFFGDRVYTTPEQLAADLRVSKPQSDYRRAADLVRWNEGNGP